MAAVLIGVVLAAALSANPPICDVKLGEWFDKRCDTTRIGDMTLRSVGATRPDPRIAMTCWKYELARGSERATFQQCHSGVLGGISEFTLDGQQYVVDLDVPWCGTRVDRIGMIVWRKAELRNRYDERVHQRSQTHPCVAQRP